MTIRTYKLAAIIVLPWLVLAGGTQAAETASKPIKTVEKQKLVKKAKARKIHHPCARKSAQQLNKRAQPYLKSIEAHAKAYGVDSELVKSVITIESCYRLKARSHKGAQGLMQLIPDTAKRFGISDPYNSHQNIKGGARYLSWLSKRFDGDLSKVLAGYNAGEGKVDRYNGIPPYRETQNYVHDVLVVYKKLKEHQNPALVKAKAAAANNKPNPALTPAQRQQQLNQRRQQLARQNQLRQQKASLKVPPGMVVVIGKPAKPAYVNVPATPQQAQATHQMVIGQPAVPAVPQRQVAQKPVMRPVVRPVFRKVRALIPRQPNNPLQAQVNQSNNHRVKSVFTAPIKPGRGGWMANKALAPQLFKQQ